MIGAIAGADVLLPPPDVRGEGRMPADRDAVGRWLMESTGDALIVSAEYLAFGNLISSRITDDSTLTALPRLNLLAKQHEAGKTVYAFSLITRVPLADNNIEEPVYWGTHGVRLHRLSGLLHRQAAGLLSPDELALLADLQSDIPTEYVTDWLRRRLRNHTISLALIDLLARGGLDFLLVTSDDTSEWGLPSREKTWLEGWLNLLGPDTQSRLLMHPGADEVGSALVARMICERRQVRPRLFPFYIVPGGENIVAPYEDRASRLTVEGQIRACGGQVAPSAEEADIILAVLPPSPRRTEFRAAFAEQERAERYEHYVRAFTQIGHWQASGIPVALADVTYPNGADPLAMELLLAPDPLCEPGRLAAWGAWNTAGNTLGTTVAQAVCSLFIGSDSGRQAAQDRFLAHRFLEDWGYQAQARHRVRDLLETTYGVRDPHDPAQIVFTCTAIERELTSCLARLQESGIGRGLRLMPGSTYLPWQRTFEVDFTLEAV